jgi:hypothetical protein
LFKIYCFDFHFGGRLDYLIGLMPVGWYKKHVCGCEGKIPGKNSQSLDFYGLDFPFSSLSL